MTPRDVLAEVVRRQKFLLRQTGAMIHARGDIQREWQNELDRCETQANQIIEAIVNEKLSEARNELSDCIHTFQGQGVDAIIPLFERLSIILGQFDEALKIIDTVQ